MKTFTVLLGILLSSLVSWLSLQSGPSSPPLTEAEAVLALQNAPDMRQWHYGVEMRYLVDHGKAWYLLKNFRMSREEQDEWLWEDEQGVKQIQPIDSAFLELDGVLYPFQNVLGNFVASVPVADMLGSELEIYAYNAGGTRIFDTSIALTSFF